MNFYASILVWNDEIKIVNQYIYIYSNIGVKISLDEKFHHTKI